MSSTRREFVYKDEAGRYSLAFEAKRTGDRVIGPGGVLSAERVIPEPRYSPPRLFSPRRQMKTGRRLAYLYLRGVIFYAEEGNSPATGWVRYKKIWPVLKDEYPDDLDALVDRILGNKLKMSTDIPMIEEYLVRADNFFILGQTAWFSNRFHFYSGSLTDGKHFRGTVSKVAGVPKDNNPASDYNHVIRCWVYQEAPSVSAGYRMLTEERVMRSSSFRRAYENNRAIINEYVSADLKNWAFSRTVGEDLRIDPKDHYNKTPIAGLPVNYLPRIFEHLVSSGGDSQLTGLSNRLKEINPQPAEIYIERAAGGYRAYINRYGVNTTWTSADGIGWVQESTLNFAYSRQAELVAQTSVVSLGKKK
ncbi:MAG: hypothetical protein J3T61_07075 [Candidatus Brocadiales bacterium]|nr:hypothetical protein [Candidatus Bathyanammoxibius sp.]